MIRPFALSAMCAAVFSLIGGSAFAQGDSAAKPAKATARQPAKAQAKRPAAAATESLDPVSSMQLDIASRVLTGDAQCEFDQRVTVRAIEGKPGHFNVRYKNATYTMVPQETTTGAVRLEDKRAGVVWLQIPAKSMLMNSKLGQRMVDSCTQSQQRAAL